MCRQWHGIRGFHGIITFNVTSPWHHLIEFFWNTTHINTTREALFRLKKKTAYLATLREHLAAQCAIGRLGGFGRLQDCKWSWSCFPSSSAGNNENDEHFRHHYFQCNITAETPCRGNPPRLPPWKLWDKSGTEVWDVKVRYNSSLCGTREEEDDEYIWGGGTLPSGKSRQTVSKCFYSMQSHINFHSSRNSINQPKSCRLPKRHLVTIVSLSCRATSPARDA